MENMILFPAINVSAYILMWGIERVIPARTYYTYKHWTLFGWLCFVSTGLIASMIPTLFSPHALGIPSLFFLDSKHITVQILLPWLLLTFVGYVWHRTRHRVDLIWRYSHQLHHAPQRIDVSVSVMFHPFETCVFSLLSILVCSVLFNLSPIAAGSIACMQSILGMFQHWNVRTPRWLGYIIQRPEAHCLHHSQKFRDCNFSDFPLWDILGGTFINPTVFRGRVGFAAASDLTSIKHMLGGKGLEHAVDAQLFTKELAQDSAL